MPAGAVTRADSVARLTLALTPSSLDSFFSTRATQDAQVMPSTARSMVRAARTEALASVRGELLE
jgi:hypothetical protein